MIVRWKPRALKDLDKATREVREKIETAIDQFAEAETGDVRHLVNSRPPRYRLRVGTWRVIFIRGDAAVGKQIVFSEYCRATKRTNHERYLSAV